MEAIFADIVVASATAALEKVFGRAPCVYLHPFTADVAMHVSFVERWSFETFLQLVFGRALAHIDFLDEFLWNLYQWFLV